MLVRISFSSFIVPKGIYKLNDESGEIEFEEEWKIPDLAELGTLESWHHFHPNILNAGRVTHFVDPNLNEEDRQAEIDRLNEVDPVVDKLKTLNEDKPLEGHEQNYTIKNLGS